MNCTHHIRNQVSIICIAPHKCKCQRKLCIQCLYEHGVDFRKYTVPKIVFQEMIVNKQRKYVPQEPFDIAYHRIKFKSMISKTQYVIKQIWDQLTESISKIYDLLEMEDKSNLKIMEGVNPTELSNTDLEKLIQIIIGNSLEDWNILKLSQLNRLEAIMNYWEMETKEFCEKLNKEMKEITQLIKSHDNNQVYNRNDDLYEVLTQTKNIDGSFFNELITIMRKENTTNCLEFFSKNSKDQTLFKYISNLMQNMSELDFNNKNYSTENNDKLIKQISYDQHIIEFLKFLVYLTAIDERFIQCGSNSLNLLVKMNADLRQQNFENIRIRDISLVGGNFVRCNFSKSEFDNVDNSGMNLNQALLLNCKWKNIKIHELNELDGHSSYVNSVIFSSDGTTLASGSSDNSIRLWDVKTGQEKAKLYGHLESVNSICYSPDGTTLASGSSDKSIRLWDVKTGQLTAKLDGHSSYVNSICYSPDGTTLASGSSDKSIRLWDVKTGQLTAKLDGHSSAVYSICYSPDGTTLGSGSDDKSIRLWDAKTGQQKAKLDGHSFGVTSICYSPDGTTLASGSYDKSIRLWNVKTAKEDLAQVTFYTDFLSQIKMHLQSPPIQYNTNFDCTIRRICQNPNLEAKGTLILQGEIVDYKGQDLRSLFQSKGSLIIENQLQLKHN